MTPEQNLVVECPDPEGDGKRGRIVYDANDGSPFVPTDYGVIFDDESRGIFGENELTPEAEYDERPAGMKNTRDSLSARAVAAYHAEQEAKKQREETHRQKIYDSRCNELLRMLYDRLDVDAKREDLHKTCVTFISSGNQVTLPAYLTDGFGIVFYTDFRLICRDYAGEWVTTGQKFSTLAELGEQLENA